MKVYRTMNLGFGMVSIPVKLYKLTDDASSVSLCQYHSAKVETHSVCHTHLQTGPDKVRLDYCPKCDKLVPATDIVFEVCGTAVKEPQYCPKCEKLISKEEIGKAYAEDSKKTKLIPITPEELAYLPLPSKETIQIDGTIEKYPDDRYPDEKYGLEPEDKGKRAFALFEAVLRKSGQMGVAKVTLGTKEHLCTVYPTGNGLLYMQTMRWFSDLRDMSELKAPEVIISEKEMQMAEMLLGTLPKDVDLASYQNDYGTALRKLVESKKAGITMTGPVATPAVKEVDLIDALMASLKQAKVA
jgi:DNA end-binding protein Ku